MPKGQRKDSVSPSGKCFKYDDKGYWKWDCSKLAKASGMRFALVIEEYLVVDSTDSWIVDSGATNHICNSLQVLQ